VPWFWETRPTRTLEKQIEDWARVVGPSSAMIVGSEIYKAPDPGKAAREIMELRDRVVARI
jgi:orotidine-5'-phosphate decarboxylase